MNVSLSQLFLAISRGEVHTVRDILSKNPALVNETDENLCTPLHASLGEDHEVCLLLLDLGANALLKDYRGWTSLHHICVASPDSAATDTIISRLLAAGCEIDARDTLGRTPLMLAAGLGNVEMAKRLLSRPEYMDINAQDNNGNTALHHASNERNLLLCRMIHDAGADLQIANFSLYTADDISRKKAILDITATSESLITSECTTAPEETASNSNFDSIYRETSLLFQRPTGPPSPFETNDDPNVVDAAATLLSSHDLLCHTDGLLRDQDISISTKDSGIVVCLHLLSTVEAWSHTNSSGKRRGGESSPNDADDDFDKLDDKDGDSNTHETSSATSFLMHDIVRVMVVAGCPYRAKNGVLLRRGHAISNRDGSNPSHILPQGHEIWFAPCHVFDIEAPFCALDDEDFDVIFHGMETSADTASPSVLSHLYNISHSIAVYGTLALLMRQYGQVSNPSHQQIATPEPSSLPPAASVNLLCRDYQGSVCVVKFSPPKIVSQCVSPGLLWKALMSFTVFRRASDILVPLLASLQALPPAPAYIRCVDYIGSSTMVRVPTLQIGASPSTPAVTSTPASSVQDSFASASPGSKGPCLSTTVTSPTSPPPTTTVQTAWNSLYSVAVSSYVAWPALSSHLWHPASYQPPSLGQSTSLAYRRTVVCTDYLGSTCVCIVSLPPPNPTPSAKPTEPQWTERLFALAAVQAYWPAMDSILRAVLPTTPHQGIEQKEEPLKLLHLLSLLSTCESEDEKFQIATTQLKLNYLFPTAGVSSLLSHFTQPEYRRQVTLMCHAKVTDPHNFAPVLLRQAMPESVGVPLREPGQLQPQPTTHTATSPQQLIADTLTPQSSVSRLLSWMTAPRTLEANSITANSNKAPQLLEGISDDSDLGEASAEIWDNLNSL